MCSLVTCAQDRNLCFHWIVSIWPWTEIRVVGGIFGRRVVADELLVARRSTAVRHLLMVCREPRALDLLTGALTSTLKQSFALV